jgi:hypothetical protein
VPFKQAKITSFTFYFYNYRNLAKHEGYYQLP